MKHMAITWQSRSLWGSPRGISPPKIRGASGEVLEQRRQRADDMDLPAPRVLAPGLSRVLLFLSIFAMPPNRGILRDPNIKLPQTHFSSRF